jgi:hypothetical protein
MGFQFHHLVWRGCNIKLRVCLILHRLMARNLPMSNGERPLRLYKHWLEYDAAALGFLIVGIAAVGLLVMII